MNSGGAVATAPVRRRAAVRAWLILTAVGLALLVAGLIFVGTWARRGLVREIEQDPQALAGHERLTHWAIGAHLADLEQELLRLSRLENLRSMIVGGKRPELLEEIVPPLNRLRKGHLGVSRITVYTADGVAFLRAHAPESHGDSVLAERRLVAEAVATRRVVKGLEAEAGVPHLWVATPLYRGNRVVAVLEVGSTLTPVVDTMKRLTGGDVAIVRGTSTSQATDVRLFAGVAPLLNRPEGARTAARQVVGLERKTYAASLVPLTDFSGRGAGALVILTDASAITEIMRRSNLAALAISFGGFGLAAVLLVVLARKLDRFYGDLEARTRELDRSLGEMKALGEVSQAVGSTLDLETVLTTIDREPAPGGDGARRVPRPPGGAPAARGAPRRRAAGPPPGTGPVQPGDPGAAPDLRHPVGAGDPECPAVPRDRGEGTPARRRQPGQERLPGEHEPRAADADERDHRLHRDAHGGDRRAGRAGSADGPREDPGGGQAPPVAHQRHPRSVEDRGREDDPLSGIFRGGPGREGGGGDGAAPGPEAGQQTRNTLRRGRGVAARRRHEGPPDALQPAQQRGQVHRERDDPPRRRAPAGGGPGVARLPGRRHRDRDDPGADGPAFPDVHAGRRFHHAQVRGHGAGTGDQQAVLPDDRRRHHRRQPGREGVDVHGDPAGAGGGAGGSGRLGADANRRPGAASRRRPDSSSMTTRPCSP